MSLSTIFTDKVLSMQPYHVPRSGGMIKLDAMESPYNLPDEMREALGKMLSMTNINRYPSARSVSLAAQIRDKFQLPKDCEVLLGNGSDEIIQMILTATMRSGAKVLSPVPSFVMYQQMAEILGMQFTGVDLKSDFTLDETAFLEAVRTHQPSVIFLAYPNNPTGQLLDKSFIKQVAERSSGLVVLDESYTAYINDSCAELIEKYDNVVLIRTFSKVGLAGIRLGYLAGNAEIIEQINKVRMPHNVNILTQTTARFMLEQMAFINESARKILAEKSALYNKLSVFEKVTVYSTQTNFLLVRVPNADEVFTRLRDDYKILVKNLHGTHAIMDNILRITIGNERENQKLEQALSEILSK